MHFKIIAFILDRMKENNIHQEAILALHYLPNLDYFASILYFDKIIIDTYEHYEKQSYRNRTEILTTQGKMSLTVPVVKQSGKQVMQEVQIDYTQKWARHHWRSICTAYGKAPFFEHYAHYFEPFFHQNFDSLTQLNWQILTLCLNILSISKQITLSDHYIKESTQKQQIDLRTYLHPKNNTQNQRLFGIPSYIQVFGKPFVANLSILDLIFCEGPNAKQLLKQSIIKNNYSPKVSFLV